MSLCLIWHNSRNPSWSQSRSTQCFTGEDWQTELKGSGIFLRSPAPMCRIFPSRPRVSCMCVEHKWQWAKTSDWQGKECRAVSGTIGDTRAWGMFLNSASCVFSAHTHERECSCKSSCCMSQSCRDTHHVYLFINRTQGRFTGIYCSNFPMSVVNRILGDSRQLFVWLGLVAYPVGHRGILYLPCCSRRWTGFIAC